MRDLRTLKPRQPESRKRMLTNDLPKNTGPLDRFEEFSRTLKRKLIALGVVTGEVYERRWEAKQLAEGGQAA